MEHADRRGAHRRRPRRSARAAAPLEPSRGAQRRGTDEDVHCALSQITLATALPRCGTSLRALAVDLCQLHAIEPTPSASPLEKLHFVLAKNDRMYYLMGAVTAALVAVVVLRTLLCPRRGG